MISVRDETADPVIAELRQLLPKGIAVNQAFKIHRDEIRAILYEMYSQAYEDGASYGYDRGYCDGCESTAEY
jgi:hypothetical protein